MTTVATRNSRYFRQADRIIAKTAAAVAAATGAGLVGQAQPAQAQIVYSGTVNINIPTTTSGVYLNLVTGVNNPSPGSAPGWDINPWGSGSLFIWANNAAPDGVVQDAAGGSSATLVDNLPLNFSVSGASSFSRTNGIETTGSTAYLLNSTSNYAGIRFLDESSGVTKFGWVQFSLSGTFAGQPRSIIAYAYENSGAAIAVGAVPEPTSLALLSLGATGLVARRLRRGKVSEKVDDTAA